MREDGAAVREDGRPGTRQGGHPRGVTALRRSGGGVRPPGVLQDPGRTGNAPGAGYSAGWRRIDTLLMQ